MLQQDIHYLVSLIQVYAEKHSNPVLDVLGQDTPIKNHKYPQNELHFGDNNWRGFYHCHDSPAKEHSEHGHFHLFVRTGEEQWSHVVGLAMDYDGQPIAWFTVNQWVTDGVWTKSSTLKPMLETMAASSTLSQVEKWLLAMVSVYRNTLCHLLDERDEALIRINAHKPEKTMLQNKDVYLLSRSAIDLQSDLNTLTQPC